MKTTRLSWLAPVLGLVLANCGGGDEGAAPHPKKTQTAAQQLCAKIADYADTCGGSTCVEALVADCSNVAGLLSEPFVEGVTGCMIAEATASPMTCFTTALSNLKLGAAQTGLVSGICTTCTDIPLVPESVTAQCQSAFTTGFDVPSATGGDPTHIELGALFAVLGDDLAATLQTQCVTSALDCVPSTFQTCATQVLLDKGFPTNSLECFMKSVLGGGDASGEPACASNASGAGGGTSASGGDTSMSGGDSTSSTGTGSSSSGSPTQCDGQGSCDACMQCAANGVCAGQTSDCANNKACMDLVVCANQCSDPATADECYNSCVATYPEGVSAYQALAYCIACTSCPTDCDGASAGCP